MKKIILFFSIIILLYTSISAQRKEWHKITLIPRATQFEEVTITKKGVTQQQYYTSFGSFAIGKDSVFNYSDSTVTYHRCRSSFSFSLSSADIPEEAVIDSVIVNYSTGGVVGHTLKITQLTSLVNEASTNWASIGNSSSLNTGIPYSGNPFVSNQIKEALKNKLSSGNLLLGMACENETKVGTNANVIFSLDVCFIISRAQVNLKVQNDLDGEGNGGHIGMSVYPKEPVSSRSPLDFYVYETDKLNLQAYDDNVENGFTYVFNDTEGPARRSKWEKATLTSIINYGESASFTSDQITKNDNLATFYARLKKDDHFTGPGTLPRDQKWWKNVTLTGDVTVPNGTTLYLFKEITVNLNGHSISSAGGTITNEGAVINGVAAYIKSGSGIVGYCGSLQSAVNTAKAYQTIELLNQSYNGFTLENKNHVDITANGATINGNITLNDLTSCDIDGGIIKGNVNLNNLSYCYLSGMHLSPNYRFEVNYGTGSRLTNVQADNTSPLYVYSSTGFDAAGFKAYYGRESDIACNIYNSTGDIFGESRFQGNLCAVYLGSNSRFNIIETYFCNNSLDAYAESSSYVFLQHNTYSAPTPYSLGGNYEYVPDVFEQVCSSPTPSQHKTSEGLNKIALTPSNETDKMYMELIRKINKDELRDQSAIKEKYKTEYYNIISKSKDELKNDVDIKKLKNSLSRIIHCYKWLDEREEMVSYLNELLSQNELQSMSPYIKRYNIEGFLNIQDYKAALQLSDEILNNKDIDQDLRCEMLYEKGIINRFYIKNNSEAYRAFSAITEQYPKHALARMAKGQLSDIPKGEDKPYLKAIAETSGEFKCTNYPNPFNPLTTFNFSIPNDGFTELKIYNSLGQEVKTLVSENLSKGQYSFEWNANNYSSGIYYYTLKCGELVSSNKIILMK